VLVRILDVINKTAPYFEKQGIDSARLMMELMWLRSSRRNGGLGRAGGTR